MHHAAGSLPAMPALFLEVLSLEDDISPISISNKPYWIYTK